MLVFPDVLAAPPQRILVNRISACLRNSIQRIDQAVRTHWRPLAAAGFGALAITYIVLAFNATDSWATERVKMGGRIRIGDATDLGPTNFERQLYGFVALGFTVAGYIVYERGRPCNWHQLPDPENL